MGTCYTYLLYDDFDWEYRNKTKEETLADLKQDLPVAEILAVWSHYAVVDLDKISPFGDSVQKLQKYCDSAYYYADSAGYELHKLNFKKTEEDVGAEIHKHRLAKKRQKAYEEWKDRYDLKCH